MTTDKQIDRALDAYADEVCMWSWHQRGVGVYRLIRDATRTRVFKFSADGSRDYADSAQYEIFPINAADDKTAREIYQSMVHRAAMSKALGVAH